MVHPDDPRPELTGASSPRSARDVAATVLLAAGLILVVATTTFSAPETLDRAHEAAPGWVPLRTVEMLLNVALFVPLGVAVGLLARARWLWALVALSVTIELVQLTMPERQTELIDVVTNSTGAMLGYVVGRRLRRDWR